VNVASILAVLDFPPQLDYPSGFAPRAYHLLRAIGTHWPLEVLALNRTTVSCTQDSFLSEHLPVNHFWSESVGANPLYAPGLNGRLRRVYHYFFGSRSALAYPDRLQHLGAYLIEHKPELAIFFLPHLAHLSFELPRSMPCIYILEEGLERSHRWVAPLMPSWKLNWMDRTERARARRMYEQIATRGGRVVAISDGEKNWFAKFIPEKQITVIPHGVDCEYYVPFEAANDIDVAVFGALGHRRTYEPALELFSSMKSNKPDLHTGLSWGFVGADPHESLVALRSTLVNVTGFVSDVRPYYARTKIVVVPSQHGGGVKTTVLQAWAMGRPVVATSFSLTGLPARHGENVLIGESPEEMARHISLLLTSPDLRDRLARSGRKTVCEERDMKVLASQFARLCADTLKQPL
jgi:glycosyltransferase involved in cell wall biosynthesis